MAEASLNFAYILQNGIVISPFFLYNKDTINTRNAKRKNNGGFPL